MTARSCRNCSSLCPVSKPRADGRGVKPRDFCTDKCSQDWWNRQRNTGNPPGRPKQPDRHKRYYLYGLTQEDVYYMWLYQGGRCDICKDRIEISTCNVDHNHDTDENRGLLCGFCNRGLGQFKDTLYNLKEAVKYLERTI